MNRCTSTITSIRDVKTRCTLEQDHTAHHYYLQEIKGEWKHEMVWSPRLSKYLDISGF